MHYEKNFGEVRYEWGVTGTKYRFQGQRSTEFDLYDFNARFYDAYITHFSQPDTIVPDQYNPLDWNRYAYARYNPLRYSDPTGHIPFDEILDVLFLAYDVGAILIEGPTQVNMAALSADAACALIPYATGGGIATRLGSKAAVAAVQAGVSAPAAIRAGQGIEKLFQLTDSSPEGGFDSQNESIARITPPTRRGDLRKAMGTPDPNMAKPQAHHNLPWKFRDWFAGPGRGLNVNDPQFGRWVEGSPIGKHQNWTSAYNKAWADFIRANPNATQQEVLDYLDELLSSGKYPSQ